MASWCWAVSNISSSGLVSVPLSHFLNELNFTKGSRISVKIKSIAVIEVVLATVPNSRVCSGCGSNPEPKSPNGSYHMKIRTIAIGLALPPTTRHFNTRSLAPIKYLSSDHIMTWSTCKLCSFMGSFTSRFQQCDWTNNRWVAIDYPRISGQIGRYFTAILWIVVGSQIWLREVKERIKLHNLRVDRVMMRLELKNLITGKGQGTQ